MSYTKVLAALSVAMILGAASAAYASGDIPTSERYKDLGALNSGRGNPGYHHSLRGTTLGVEGAYARAPRRQSK
jgi:hypothetical protein